MNQNTFCSNCHRIPSQCCCSSVKELTIHEDIVYGLAYKYGIEKGDVLDFSKAILRKAKEK